MLIPLQEILSKYNIHPKGVIHVGAHWAEEHDDYVKCGIERFVYIEPCEEAVKVVANKLSMSTAFLDQSVGVMGMVNDNIYLYPVACGREEKKEVMFVSPDNQGQSNSLLQPLLHLKQHPDIVFNEAEVVSVYPLDKLIIKKENYDMLVMDCQGYEGEVLLGARKTLDNINIIYTEVNRGQTYLGNKEIDWVDGFLMSQGFVRKETFWPSPNLTWGDAVYIRVAKRYRQ